MYLLYALHLLIIDTISKYFTDEKNIKKVMLPLIKPGLEAYSKLSMPPIFSTKKKETTMNKIRKINTLAEYNLSLFFINCIFLGNLNLKKNKNKTSVIFTSVTA